MALNGEMQGDADALDTKEGLDSLGGVLTAQGPDGARFLLERLRQKAQRNCVDVSVRIFTPYINTIPPDRQPAFPGDRDIERRIKSYLRWNALAMVARANLKADGIGGPLASLPPSPPLLDIRLN